MRTAVQLKELGELSNRETAGRMGVSVGTVKARLFHARRKLGKTLKPYMRPRQISRSGTPALANDAGPMSLAYLTAPGIRTVAKGGFYAGVSLDRRSGDCDFSLHHRSRQFLPHESPSLNLEEGGSCGQLRICELPLD